MAYDKEFSKYTTLSNMLSNERLKEFLSEMKIIHHDKKDFEKIDNFIFEKNIDDLVKEDRLKYIFAFDGSKNLVDLKTGFPTAELGFIRVGHVLVDLEKMIKYQDDKFPNPSDYNKIYESTTVDAIIPGFNVCGEDFTDSKDFFRYAVFSFFQKAKNNFLIDLFKEKNIKKEPITFLDSLINLMKTNVNFSAQHPCHICESSSKSFDVNSFFNFGDSYLNQKMQCACKNNPKDLYVTDFLRAHEVFSSGGGNDGLYTQIMSLIEKIMFFNLIENLVEVFKDEKEKIKEIAFILDGPLALYNTSSWLSQAILKKMIEYQKDGYDLLVLGVEKSGNFVDHLIHMNTSANGEKELNNGFLFFLNDSYIKKFIKYSSSKAPYGQDTYFGKKLYYKNKRGSLFVMNYMYLSKEDQVNFYNSKNEDSYIKMQKRLRDVVWILEKFSSVRYKNALSFVSFAHENVAIQNSKMGQGLISSFVMSNLDNKNKLE